MRDTSACPRPSSRSTSTSGLAAEDKALALNPEYFEALSYKNILLRLQANYREGPGQAEGAARRRPTSSRNKALELQKKQNASGAAAAPKGRGGE